MSWKGWEGETLLGMIEPVDVEGTVVVAAMLGAGVGWVAVAVPEAVVKDVGRELTAEEVEGGAVLPPIPGGSVLLDK